MFLEIGGIISTMSINIIPYTKKLSRINVGAISSSRRADPSFEM